MIMLLLPPPPGELKGVMRVGAFARGIQLKGECSVELVVMTANKPNVTLFQSLARTLPAKFEVCVPQLICNGFLQ